MIDTNECSHYNQTHKGIKRRNPSQVLAHRMMGILQTHTKTNYSPRKGENNLIQQILLQDYFTYFIFDSQGNLKANLLNISNFKQVNNVN